MAKGQMRSNKEAKKPKKDKLKAAAAPSTGGFAKAGQPAGAAPKKKYSPPHHGSSCARGKRPLRPS
jgi:hypothetical protein